VGCRYRLISARRSFLYMQVANGVAPSLVSDFICRVLDVSDLFQGEDMGLLILLSNGGGGEFPCGPQGNSQVRCRCNSVWGLVSQRLSRNACSL
jgi:hypothetical protein